MKTECHQFKYFGHRTVFATILVTKNGKIMSQFGIFEEIMRQSYHD